MFSNLLRVSDCRLTI